MVKKNHLFLLEKKLEKRTVFDYFIIFFYKKILEKLLKCFCSRYDIGLLLDGGQRTADDGRQTILQITPTANPLLTFLIAETPIIKGGANELAAGIYP